MGKPQRGKKKKKEAFWGRMDDEVAKATDVSMVTVGGDLNGHTGHSREGSKEVMGVYGFGERNTRVEDLKHKLIIYC